MNKFKSDAELAYWLKRLAKKSLEMHVPKIGVPYLTKRTIRYSRLTGQRR